MSATFIASRFCNSCKPMRRLTLIVCLLTPALEASDLPTLRATLRQLQGRSALNGSAEYALFTRTRDGRDLREEQGGIRLGWTATATGVSLSFPGTLLSEAEREQRARRADPDYPSPTRNAVYSFHVLQIAEAVDFATTLLRELEGAELLSTEGTALTFQLPPRLARTERKHVRNAEALMTVWLGQDGVPVRVERTVLIRASFFFLRFETGRTDRWELKRQADRLIAVRHEAEDTTAGLNRSVTARTTTTLTIQ